MFSLRPYQIESIKSVKKKWEEGLTRLLVVLPTGTGKTIVFATLTKDLDKRTLIIAHTEELIQQAIDKIKMVYPSADIGVIKAERNEIDHKIVVASIQTIRQDNRLQLLQEQNFELLIIDEAHHSIAESYAKVINELGFMNEDLNKLLVGFTATPKRGDGEGLDHVFQEIAYRSYILKMIEKGYLSDVKCQSIKTQVDITEVGTYCGDFAVNQLASVVNTTDRNKLIVKSYVEHAKGTKTIAFCVNVQHAKDLAKEFNKHKVKAKAVYGEMKQEERLKVIDELRRGEIDVVTNCMVLTEGFDEEGIKTLLMCRPTKSQSLFIQMVGRGLRLYPGKQFCLVLDFADNSKHKLSSVASLLGDKKEKEVEIKDGETLFEAVARTNQELRSQGKLISEEVDLLERSRINWIEIQSLFRATIGTKKYIELTPVTEGFEINLVDNATVSKLSDEVLSLEYAQGIAEDYIREHNFVLADKDAPWRSEPPTEKQIKMLKKNKQYKKGITKGEAHDIISVLFGNRRW